MRASGDCSIMLSIIKVDLKKGCVGLYANADVEMEGYCPSTEAVAVLELEVYFCFSCMHVNWPGVVL